MIRVRIRPTPHTMKTDQQPQRLPVGMLAGRRAWPVWWSERGDQNPIPSRTRPLTAPAPMVLCLKTRESRSPPDLPSTSYIPSSRSEPRSPPGSRPAGFVVFGTIDAGIIAACSIPRILVIAAFGTVSTATDRMSVALARWDRVHCRRGSSCRERPVGTRFGRGGGMPGRQPAAGRPLQVRRCQTSRWVKLSYSPIPPPEKNEAASATARGG
jgi:hypothetical protein